MPTDAFHPDVPSYYRATRNPAPERAPLCGTHTADVCIVGAGLTGLSAALHLAERGYRVLVLESEFVGYGASGRNGGHVGVGQRHDQAALEEMLGRDAARRLWDFGLQAVRLVEELIVTHGIDCDLKRGIVHLAAKRRHAAELEAEAAKLRERYGYERIEYVADASRCVGSDRYFGAQVDHGSLHLHPLNFVLGLAAAAERAGATIHEQSRVTGVSYTDDVRVVTADGAVDAEYLIVACNGYLGRLVPKLAGRIMPINNFVVATEPLGPEIAERLVPGDRALQDTLFVINYWKRSADDRLLFGGGENYTRRFPDDIAGFVRPYLERIYPGLRSTAIDYAWGGTLAITLNRLPDFGRLGPNAFYAHGYSGHGVPTATFAGRLLSEVTAGTAERFDVMASLPIRAFPGGTLLRWPGLVLGMLYYSLRDRLG